jgi:hypothetical protein
MQSGNAGKPASNGDSGTGGHPAAPPVNPNIIPVGAALVDQNITRSALRAVHRNIPLGAASVHRNIIPVEASPASQKAIGAGVAPIMGYPA